MALLRRFVIGMSYGVTVVLSALYEDTLPFIGSGIYIVKSLAAVLFFVSIALSTKIHQLLPERHEKPSDFPKLHTEGPYAHCRHPLYLLLILLQFSIPLYYYSMEGTVIALLTLPAWYMLARAEEKDLLKYYGEAYRKYMHRVPMFIPLKKHWRTNKH
jgi:protein-S-isoprenylcysteine O-methyltransferase Ste14